MTMLLDWKLISTIFLTVVLAGVLISLPVAHFKELHETLEVELDTPDQASA